MIGRILFWGSIAVAGAMITFGLIAAARGASAGHAGLFAAGSVFCVVGVCAVAVTLAIARDD